MISFTSFDNFEKQAPPANDHEPKTEDFPAFLFVPVAPSNFQPPQKSEAIESPEIMVKAEFAESTPIVLTNCKTDPQSEIADFPQKTEPVQTTLLHKFLLPQAAEILHLNGSKTAKTGEKVENILSLQKSVLTKIQTMTSSPSPEYSPLTANPRNERLVNSDIENVSANIKNYLENDFNTFVRIDELSINFPVTESGKPEFSRRKTFVPNLAEIEFVNVNQLPKEEAADLKLSVKALPETRPEIREFDVKSPEWNNFKNLLNVKTSSAETMSTKDPGFKSMAEPLDIKQTQIDVSQTKATFETLGSKSTQTDVEKFKQTPEITEGDFEFNFDKFLTDVTKQSKALERAVKNPLESQKIFEQVEPQVLQIVSTMTDENEKKVMKMRLHPADLGTIEVRLEKNSAGNLVAHFRTETEAARQSLTQNLEQLRDSLQSSGCQVDELDVTCQKFSTGDGEQPAKHSQPSDPFDYPSTAETNIDRNSHDQNDLKQTQASRLLSVRA